jgi:hypothetical protein
VGVWSRDAEQHLGHQVLLGRKRYDLLQGLRLPLDLLCNSSVLLSKAAIVVPVRIVEKES